MRKIGLFGSSFNPIHIGHLICIEQAIVKLDLEKVLLIPTKNPYHKKTDSLDFEIRLKMAEIESGCNSKLDVSEVERRIEGQSYSYDVINMLSEEYEDTEFYFIIGSDSLISFDKWYKSEELMKMCTFVVFQRPEDQDIKSIVQEFRNKGMKLIFIDDTKLEVSSSYIRESVSQGKSIKYLVTNRIEKFILENGYYENV